MRTVLKNCIIGKAESHWSSERGNHEVSGNKNGTYILRPINHYQACNPRTVGSLSSSVVKETTIRRNVLIKGSK